jgi:hypothetical protein
LQIAVLYFLAPTPTSLNIVDGVKKFQALSATRKEIALFSPNSGSNIPVSESKLGAIII